MTTTLSEIDPPQWMLDLFKSIDDLDFSQGGGFDIFAEEIVMQFGTESLHGIEEVKKFFVKLDAPFITKHFVAKVFQFDRAFVMQGSASLRKKGDPPEKTFDAAPLFNLLWFNEDGKVIRYVVDFPPDAAKEAEL